MDDRSDRAYHEQGSSFFPARISQGRQKSGGDIFVLLTDTFGIKINISIHLSEKTEPNTRSLAWGAIMNRSSRGSGRDRANSARPPPSNIIAIKAAKRQQAGGLAASLTVTYGTSVRVPF
jgi:hypothetical protein